MTDTDTTTTGPKQNERHYTLDAETRKAALGVNCNIPYCKAEPKASCVSTKGEKVDPHTMRVRKGLAKIVREAKRAEKAKADAAAAKEKAAKKAADAKAKADKAKAEPAGKAAYTQARDLLAAGKTVDEELLNEANAYAKTAKRGRLSNEQAG